MGGIIQHNQDGTQTILPQNQSKKDPRLNAKGQFKQNKHFVASGGRRCPDKK